MLSTPGHRAATNPATGMHVAGFRPFLELSQHRGAPRVWTSSEIPADVVIGPFDDSLLNFGERISEDSSDATMIEVKVSFGRVVSACGNDSTKWAWHIAAARNDHEQNLSAERTSDGMVIFKTTRRILKGEELRVWHSPDLAKNMGVPAHVGTYQAEDRSFVCPVCSKKFRYPNTLKAHLMSCGASSKRTSTARPPHRQEPLEDSTRIGSAFRRVTPRSIPSSSSFTTTATLSDVVTNGSRRPEEHPPAETNGNSTKNSSFKSNPSRSSPKVGFRAFRKSSSPSSTHMQDTTMSSSDSTRKDSSNVLFSVDKMLNHTEPQSSSSQSSKSPIGLDKNANPFDPLAIRSQLSIPTGIGQYRPIDPYLPIRCFQPVIPTITRYGSILPPAHHRGLYSGVPNPYFPYKVPIPAPLKFVHPTHPIPSPNEIEMPKFAGLDRNHLPGASSSFQVGETQYSYLQDSSRKNKRGHLCIYCGKLYSRKYGLKIHLRTHTGYKPLKCKVCLRPFGDPSNLNKHIRLHAEGDTPYRCEYCGKVLVRRRDLERHIRSRHPAEAKKREKESEEAEDASSHTTHVTDEDDHDDEEDVDMTSPHSPDVRKPTVFEEGLNPCIDVQSKS
ncbi:zinc finger E-box-binding homeobox 1-like [Lytechinus pictus]|uniref:zinc finger E-box-binding homeobox 1-like n=1 Tax=Lytechinus pictus TaxID=7653 RepID=UPI0030B9CC54